MENKIPYDASPISREQGGGGTKQKRNVSVKKSRPVLVFVLVVVFVAVAALGGYLAANTTRKNLTQILELTYNVNSNSPDLSVAASKSKLSSVIIGNGGTDNTGKPYSATNVPTYSQILTNTTNQGAGVIYSVDKENGVAYVITCYHVVNTHRTQPIFVCLYDNLTSIAAEFVGALSSQDVAVLKITSDIIKSSKAVAATLADSSYIAEGETVFAIGNPLSHGFTVTGGQISLTSVVMTSGGTTVRCIQTSAAINAGNSGGGLFDKNGNLLGLVKAKSNDDLSNGVYVDNMAYAIPINLAANIAKSIIASGGGTIYYARPGYVAVAKNVVIKKDEATSIEYKFYEVEVTSISTTSDAYKNGSGLKNGDILLSLEVAGKVYQFNTTYTYEDIMYSVGAGMMVTYVVRHTDGTTETISYTVTAVTPLVLQ